jgi:hypothetical protein
MFTIMYPFFILSSEMLICTFRYDNTSLEYDAVLFAYAV